MLYYKIMKNNNKSRLLSGVKPTGRPHIANYFGSMKQFVDLQSDYQALIMVADLHALTTVWDADTLRRDIWDLALDYLAIGLDPEKVVIFRQSDVAEHTELTWVFNCITSVPYLMRSHAYKDASAKNQEVSVGTFDYPMLMAADILLYDPQVVPVGQDQKQHVEYARDTAEKFNRLFGETFTLPEGLILSGVQTVTGLDGRKMSKSYNNHIPLFSEPDQVVALVKKIVTDSKDPSEPKDPETCNIFALLKLFAGEGELSELRQRYRDGNIGYKESKEILAEKIIAYFEPMRKKRKEIAARPELVHQILSEGAKATKDLAAAKMDTVRKRVGLEF